MQPLVSVGAACLWLTWNSCLTTLITVSEAHTALLPHIEPNAWSVCYKIEVGDTTGAVLCRFCDE